MALQDKKFLDAEGLTYFATILNNYPDNDLLSTVIDAIGEELEGKSDVNHTHNGFAMASVSGTTLLLSRTLENGDEVSY